MRSYATAARARYAKQAQSSGLIALLLAVLLWQTKWPSLRLGLIALLLSYVGSTLLSLYRKQELSRDIEFDRERQWLTGLMLFENISRTAGFLALGYGFWVATRSVTVGLVLGVVYPALTYFGLERRNYQRRMKALETEQAEIR